ncbi:MAG: BON domain-containing protein [Bacteroidota bacterium]
MKHFITRSLLVAIVAATGPQLLSCKNDKKTESETTVPVDAPAPEPAPAAPVEVATDDQLTTNAKDATKDFPGVEATVSNGEITLTGTIARDRLPDLMMKLNALNPKKINNNLTVN